MALSPGFANTPRCVNSTGSTANALRTGAGALNDAIVAGANGTRVSRITITAQGTTTLGAIRFFVKTGAGTAAYRFEEAIPAITASATTPPAIITRSEDLAPDKLPILLQSGQTLQWTTEKAEAFNVCTEGGDF